MKGNLAFQEEAREERIGGEWVAMSPRPAVNHNRIARNICNLFSNYLRGRPCEAFPDGVDLYLTDEDWFVPDGMVVCDPDKVRPNGIYGAPDLAVEILSPGTAKTDRGYKLAAYERSGVREYWIVSPGDRSVEQYLLRDGRYVLAGVYAVYPQWMLDGMPEEQRAAVAASFRCSLFDGLTVRLEDVFARVQ